MEVAEMAKKQVVHGTTNPNSAVYAQMFCAISLKT